jgi:hypothetical protein
MSETVDNNIIFHLEEIKDIETSNSNDNINNFIEMIDKEDIEDIEDTYYMNNYLCFEDECNDKILYNYELFYNEYTIKDLLKISNYYGLDKDIKISKCKKQDIISTIVYFESLPENYEIVRKRHKMWAYITELLNDSKMKKYIIF